MFNNKTVNDFCRGDTSTDMRTAKAAGMYAVGVKWGFREAKELIESGANRLIDTPIEIVEIWECIKKG